MSYFDPNLPHSTLDFNDGATTVGANFLNAVTVRFSSINDACKSLINDGDVGYVVEHAASTIPGEVELEIETGVSTLSITDGEFIYWVQETSTTSSNLITILDFEGNPTGRTITPSFVRAAPPSALGSVTSLLSDGDYLVVASDTSNQIDIWDLATDLLIGTLAVTLPARVALHRGKLFVAAGTSLSCFVLATGLLDSGFGTAGIATVTVAERMSVDDMGIYLASAATDTFQRISHQGTSRWTKIGATSETIVYSITAQNEGDLIVVGDTNISRISTMDGSLIEQKPLGFAIFSGAQPLVVVNGWLVICTNGDLQLISLVNFNKRFTIHAENSIEPVSSDGLYIYTGASVSLGTPISGTPTNGIRSFRAPGARTTLIQRIESESVGRPPYNHLKCRPI